MNCVQRLISIDLHLRKEKSLQGFEKMKIIEKMLSILVSWSPKYISVWAAFEVKLEDLYDLCVDMYGIVTRVF